MNIRKRMVQTMTTEKYWKMIFSVLVTIAVMPLTCNSSTKGVCSYTFSSISRQYFPFWRLENGLSNHITLTGNEIEPNSLKELSGCSEDVESQHEMERGYRRLRTTITACNASRPKMRLKSFQTNCEPCKTIDQPSAEEKFRHANDVLSHIEPKFSRDPWRKGCFLLFQFTKDLKTVLI